MMMYKDKYADAENIGQETPTPVEDDFDIFELLKSMPELAGDEMPELTMDETTSLAADLPLEEPVPTQPARIPDRRAQRMAAAAEFKRRRARNSRIFYTIYIACVVLIIAAFIFLMTPLHNWLVKFEASQPDSQCQQVFDTLFADPDWGVLYDLAGLEDTQFEGRDEFVHYMNVKVANAANKELT